MNVASECFWKKKKFFLFVDLKKTKDSSQHTIKISDKSDLNTENNRSLTDRNGQKTVFWYLESICPKNNQVTEVHTFALKPWFYENVWRKVLRTISFLCFCQKTNFKASLSNSERVRKQRKVFFFITFKREPRKKHRWIARLVQLKFRKLKKNKKTKKN